MVDETNEQDFFGDGDLAQPENLPEGKKMLGEITKVDTSASVMGAFRQLDTPLKDGRTAVPEIRLTLRALMFADGSSFPEDTNYMQQADATFWIGKEDKIGRHALANLIRNVAGVDEDGMKTSSVQELAQKLQGGKISFEVKWTESKKNPGQFFQNPVKIKAVTEEELALLA